MQILLYKRNKLINIEYYIKEPATISGITVMLSNTTVTLCSTRREHVKRFVARRFRGHFLLLLLKK